MPSSFFADKIPYVDSRFDTWYTRSSAFRLARLSLTRRPESKMDAGVSTIAPFFARRRTRFFVARHEKRLSAAGANLSPEPVSNWILSILEDIIAFVGTILAVFAPVLIAIVLVIFVIFFFWFFPKVFRAIRRLFNAAAAFFRGESFKEVARRAG